MSQVPGKFVLTSDVTIQTRRAQAVDAQLAAAIRDTCEKIRHIAACYLLDARKPETGEMTLIIALALDDEPTQMDSAAQQFQSMLRQFPTQARRTHITSAAKFVNDYSGSEFYIRSPA